MNDTSSLGKLVPGFEFLQGLVKGAGAALPGIGQWIAPTLDPAELEKRIEELRTVQFWLEQNARMLGATIQAMEVQRMTLSTLKTMNVRMSDLRDSMTLPLSKMAGAASGAASPSAPAPAPAPTPAFAFAAPAAVEPAPEAEADAAAAEADRAAAASDAEPAAPPAVDPMKWWGALTQQFTELATRAIKEGAPDPTRLFGAGAAAAADRAAGVAARPKAATSKATSKPKGTRRRAAPQVLAPADAAGSATRSKAGSAARAPSRSAAASGGKPAAAKRSASRR